MARGCQAAIPMDGAPANALRRRAYVDVVSSFFPCAGDQATKGGDDYGVAGGEVERDVVCAVVRADAMGSGREEGEGDSQVGRG